MGIITNSSRQYARMRARAAGGALGRGTPVHARMHACAAARITRAVPAHDPSPPHPPSSAPPRARARADARATRASAHVARTALGHEAHAR